MSLDPNVWISTIPNTAVDVTKDDRKSNPNKWIASIPKKTSNNLLKKYSLVSTFFVLGLIIVSVIKNETRHIEKEISNLQKSIYNYKFDLHQATLEHEVITSPENISLLANEYLDTNFVFYKREQIKNLNDNEKRSTNLVKNNKPINNISKEIKTTLKAKIDTKKKELAKLQEIYSKPESLNEEIKMGVAKKIKITKEQLTVLYNEPETVITSKKVQRWAGLQVVKVFLGIPIVPGK